MIKKLLLIMISISYFSNLTFCQNSDGYWDYERATKKEIQLCASCKTWNRTDEFPAGTTEVIYRITLLDENQQLSDDLVSVLKVVPDPIGISMGTAGAISLMSKISGSDKCRFTIFSSYEDAKNYLEFGNYQTGCYINSSEINNYASRLSIANSSCLQISPNYLWFGFKSLNMFMNEKIVLEVVPWVDNKASRGWSLDVKNKFINNCKAIEQVNQLSNSEEYCQCFLDKFQENYKVQDFQQMTSTEITKISEIFGKECLTETGELKNIYDNQREEASKFAENNQYGEAINTLLDVIENDNPSSMDYNNIGFYYIFTKQYLKAIKYLKLGEVLDETELLIKGNLAHAYLLNGDIEPAKAIYFKYKNQNVSASMSWVKMVELDFSSFSKAGLQSENYELILSEIK